MQNDQRNSRMKMKKKSQMGVQEIEGERERNEGIACERALELGPFWPGNHQNNPELQVFRT